MVTQGAFSPLLVKQGIPNTVEEALRDQYALERDLKHQRQMLRSQISASASPQKESGIGGHIGLQSEFMATTNVQPQSVATMGLAYGVSAAQGEYNHVLENTIEILKREVLSLRDSVHEKESLKQEVQQLKIQVEAEKTKRKQVAASANDSEIKTTSYVRDKQRAEEERDSLAKELERLHRQLQDEVKRREVIEEEWAARGSRIEGLRRELADVYARVDEQDKRAEDMALRTHETVSALVAERENALREKCEQEVEGCRMQMELAATRAVEAEEDRSEASEKVDYLSGKLDEALRNLDAERTRRQVVERQKRLLEEEVKMCRDALRKRNVNVNTTFTDDREEEKLNSIGFDKAADLVTQIQDDVSATRHLTQRALRRAVAYGEANAVFSPPGGGAYERGEILVKDREIDTIRSTLEQSRSALGHAEREIRVLNSALQPNSPMTSRATGGVGGVDNKGRLQCAAIDSDEELVMAVASGTSRSPNKSSPY